MAISGVINLGHEPCIYAERAGASWRPAKALSKEGQHGNVVRRGVLPSVKGQCLGGMGGRWLQKNRPDRARRAAVGPRSQLRNV